MVYLFSCGHAGRTSEGRGPRAKVQAFIRVAEIREPVIESGKQCPDCAKGKQ